MKRVNAAIINETFFILGVPWGNIIWEEVSTAVNARVCRLICSQLDFQGPALIVNPQPLVHVVGQES